MVSPPVQVYNTQFHIQKSFKIFLRNFVVFFILLYMFLKQEISLVITVSLGSNEQQSGTTETCWLIWEAEVGPGLCSQESQQEG